MGKTNQLGVLADVFTSDASNNVGIGGSPSGTYKLEVTGTARVSGAATFSSSVTANNSFTNQIGLVINGNTTGGIRQNFIAQGSSGTYNFQIGTTITTNNAFEIIPSTAADGTTFSTAVFKILNTGAATFSGQLTTSTTNGGTSAIFQNTGVQNANGIELRGGTGGTSVNWKLEKDNTINNTFQLTPSTTNGGTTFTTPVLTIASTGAATFSGKTNVVKDIADYAFTVTNTNTSGYGMYIQAGGTNNAIDVYNASGATQIFKLTGTGAATFSSTVKVGSTSGGDSLVSTANAGTNPASFSFVNSGGTSYIGAESSGGGTLVTGDTGYDLVVRGPSGITFSANNGASPNMRITSGGVITISNLAGTGSRAVLADASGTLSAPVSDISVKQNITPIRYGLNEISKMNPVWFDFIDGYKNYGEGRQNGNIAQEMEAIIPEAVFTTPSTGKMGINYDQLHAVYIKAIQEQQAIITSLQDRLTKAGL